LARHTKSLLDSKLADGNYINAAGKNVLVLGGGDTGNDCLGTAVRHGAASVTNFELMPKMPNIRAKDNPWPLWPFIFRTDYGHKEVTAVSGSDPRQYSTMSKRFIDDGNGGVAGVEAVQVEWTKKKGRRGWDMAEVPGSSKTYKADIVLLALGFTGPEKDVAKELNLETDKKGNFKTAKGKYMTSHPRVFCCGDARRGQSLIVWGIAEGRECAAEIDSMITPARSLRTKL
jgi:glutamate synthase (NADPH/NADH)